MRACAIIPSYNHHRAVPGIIERLRGLGLAVLIVDDGSAERTRKALAELHAPVWWGGILTVLGATYCAMFRPRKT